MTNYSNEFYMHRCLELAKQGEGYVSPNPKVGSILVCNGKIIGEGYHQRYGQAHAEVNCILSVNKEDKKLLPESTLFVNLEPCSHTGKTPPCVDFIIQNNIPHVVIGCKDTSSKVNGKGITALRAAGVHVTENILEQECLALNKKFFISNALHRPYIIIKWAESKDGYLGKENERIKLSNADTDKLVHTWRSTEDAIWVGYRTALVDNPKLNVRHVEGKNPLRIVYDRNLSLPSSLSLLDGTQSTILYNTLLSEENGLLRTVKIHDDNYIQEILDDLYKQPIQSVLIEGGKALLQKIIDQSLWDEARVITTPVILGEGIASPILANAIKQMSFDNLQDTITFYTPSSVS